ncbi:YibE/F family protein [Candidatus Peregrinibacteria bacterium]|jgi:uncharacterized membrane protein|nr:YibE/F family protein [Candidatus Peregrinibacteria bacterium]MBT4147926.1 YibE/F family protein [Candidatus Peregrinibacteria bacterium]MBT4456417.1 YibE/F family protein [Candidatus Peregrinibacteria bacterium]
MKKLAIILYIIFATTTFALTIFINLKESKFHPPQDSSNYTHEFIHGEIKQIDTNDETRQKELKVKANSGSEEGEGIIVNVDPKYNYNEYKSKDEVLVYKEINVETGEINYEVTDYYHQTGLAVLFILFSIITIYIARKKGLNSLISVIGSIALFYFIFLKLILIGFSPLLAVLIYVTTITVLSIPPIHGFNKKSLSSIITIFLGYLVSIVITFAFKEVAQLGSASSEELRTLTVIYPGIDLVEILIASLFLGAAGAIIDTAISIASPIFEAVKKTSKTTFREVYKTGMEVGKDVLASMTNTLLLAYIASSLPFLVIITLAHSGTENAFSELINIDFIALELTRIFIGAVSLVILIPIVSSISAYFFVKNDN